MENLKMLWQGEKLIEKVENFIAAIGICGFLVALIYVYTSL